MPESTEVVGKHLRGLVEGKYRLSPGASLAAGGLVLGLVAMSQCNRYFAGRSSSPPPYVSSPMPVSPQAPPFMPPPQTAPPTTSQPAEPANQSTDAPMPGERFPETRQRELTDQEISSWNAETVQLALNEMYARHGATFRKGSTSRQFSQMSWYRPVPGQTPEQTEPLFSPTEKINRAKLMNRRTELQQATRSK
ncbi:MAG TPA: YARHG domain-containing protein [Fimbriimonadaceae bacterium]|nr:YARHG domain-containing protein [Fimbriimonadaceae bacterium]